MLYFSDYDQETHIAVHEVSEKKTKKLLLFLVDIYGKEFELVESDWADDYNFETDTLIIKSNLYIEELMEITDMGYDLLIVK